MRDKKSLPLRGKKGFAHIEILFVILAIVVLGISIFFVQRNSESSVSQASPTPEVIEEDQIGVWETYANDEYGYSISYPSDWDLTEESNVSLMIIENNYQTWQGTFQVKILENTENLSLEKWVSQFEKESASGAKLVLEVEDMEIARKPAKKLHVFAFDHTDASVVFTREDKIFSFNFVDRDNPNDPESERHQRVYDQILSTFEFTD